MLRMCGNWKTGLLMAGLVLSVSTSARVQADGPEDEIVDLRLAPVIQTVNIGDTVEIGLIAQSASGGDIPMAAIQAILNFDPNVLELQGLVNNGPYDWLDMTSTFFDDSAFDDLNATWLDGDAIYLALAQFNPPFPMATPSGLLATTFIFEAVGIGEMSQISMPFTQGNFSQTVVLSGTIPALDILGSAFPAFVTVVPEPSTAAFVLILATFCVHGRSGRFFGRRHPAQTGG